MIRPTSFTSLRIWRLTIVCVLIAGMCTACDPRDVLLVRNGADSRLDNDKSAELKNRSAAAGKNIAALLGLPEPVALKQEIQPPESVTLLRLGYSYVDQQCTTYFNALMHIQRDVSSTASQFAVLGTAATAILAFTGVGSVATGIAAAATGAAVATTNNVGSDLLFALDAGTTYGLTRRAMTAYANSDPARPEIIKTYGDAFAIISGYALQCTPPKIESLVKEAVEKAQPGDASTDPLKKVREAAIADILAKVEKKTDLPAFTTEQTPLLYLLLIAGGEADPTLIKGIQDRLKTSNPSLSDKIFKTNAAGKTEVNISKEQREDLVGALYTIAYFDPTVTVTAEKIRNELLKLPAPALGAETPTPSPAPGATMVPNIQILTY